MHLDTIYNVDKEKISELDDLDKERGLSPEDRAIVIEAARHCYVPALKIYARHNLSDVYDILSKASKFDDVCPDVLSMLGVYYLNGICVSQNTEEGIRLLNVASEKGNIEATLMLGEIYKEGLFGIAKNINNAFFYFSKYADTDSDSMVLLSLLIKKNNIRIAGKGIEYVVELNKKAASLGSVEALQNLATFYYKGECVEQDFYKARIYLLNAIELGEKNYSYYNLYKLYNADDCPFRDEKKAMEYLEEGIREGSERCQIEIDRLRTEGMKFSSNI